MFSTEEKMKIAKAVEKILLDLNHPEMPKENLKFKLHVNGKERWSFADIEPHWKFNDKKPSVNPWNEKAREIMGNGNNKK